MTDRTWVEVSHRDVQPDVNVLREDRPGRQETGGIAVAEQVTTTPVVIRVPHTEFREFYLEIFARFDDRERVVTTVEVLSRSNKTPGTNSREKYLKKQKEILDGQIHLVEIDLLRAGQHSTAVPLGYLQVGVKAYDYHVCVHHFDNLEDFFIYPVHLHERLPTIAVPLLPGDGSVPLDLQAAFDRAYDTGPYRRRVRYTDPVPAPALTEEKAAWIEKVLRDRGLRPAPPPA
jgi:hypothetical protein